ncbi:MAG: hypothetical protein ABIJ41_07265 [Candidatus Omnitrophota bacterium]
MRKRSFFNNNFGFSLVEVLFTVAIIIFVVSLLYSSFSTGNLSWQQYQCSTEVQRQARQALVTLARELREAENFSIVTQDANNVEVNFSRDGYGAITFAWATSGAQANQILRNDNVIAHDISALSFIDNTTSVTINVTASATPPNGNPISLNLKKKVTLRT